MKRIKEALTGLIAILYGHAVLGMILMAWTIVIPILWQHPSWIHVLIAFLLPFLLYGIVGFIIARLNRHLSTIKTGSLIYLLLLWIGLGVSIYLQGEGNTVGIGVYTLVNYPIAAFYRNAPDYSLLTGLAFAGSCFMAYFGLIEGFALQRKILARREGEKR